MPEVHRVSAFDDNYIWMPAVPDTDMVAIVDPGDAAPVIAWLEQQRLRPAAILITHHHRDHTGGIGELVARYPVPVYGPATEDIPHLTHPLGDGDVVQPGNGGLQLQVLETPGHTRGHLCYYGHGLLFSGDTLFTAGCGRLFEGTAAQMHASLQRLAALPAETLVYCAHEYTADNLIFARVAEPDNPQIQARIDEVTQQRAAGLATVPAPLEVELATNPFLRCDQPVIIAGAERFAGRPLASGGEVFGAVRQWKDALD